MRSEQNSRNWVHLIENKLSFSLLTCNVGAARFNMVESMQWPNLIQTIERLNAKQPLKMLNFIKICNLIRGCHAISYSCYQNLINLAIATRSHSLTY